MAIAAYIKSAESASPTTFSVVGNSELNSLWMPIIEKEGLHGLNYMATAGTRIDESNCKDIADELQILLRHLESAVAFEDDIANPVFRCKRLLDLVTRVSSDRDLDVYVG